MTLPNNKQARLLNMLEIKQYHTHFSSVLWFYLIFMFLSLVQFFSVTYEMDYWGFQMWNTS